MALNHYYLLNPLNSLSIQAILILVHGNITLIGIVILGIVMPFVNVILPYNWESNSFLMTLRSIA